MDETKEFTLYEYSVVKNKRETNYGINQMYGMWKKIIR